ncbi:tricarboxylate transporter [Rhizobacter sp. Root16D2]|uniref:tripartite tricarboxylate transporter TctB family protein n=2 Tax=Rhizobacter TaxID=212743 RepID=UPI0006FAF189|nr:tripartite tricarboxylate transporter TctB family protein [Rhizobacter sp. Root1238]KQU77961.1 tricarboxylate transporter [Rhizobacter sp. Root29]KQW15708.1 tricarboxylate transporter [Rhizobacter sp. Root1238]KRB24818.1 tricarboxylate transporter [Rhizobacter sp. Root16D2]
MSEGESTTVGKRWPEIGMAGVLAAIALIVIVDSLRVGIGWADDGPRAGYFPFYIGGLLLAASLAIVVGELRRWRQPDPPFAERAQLRSVVAVLLPMVVYVALIWGLGIYLASALLIGYFMRRHGQYRWPATAAVSVGVPLLLFAVFEKWFLVPLPKGPIEHLLGL